jgi:hypothetical protein
MNLPKHIKVIEESEHHAIIEWDGALMIYDADVLFDYGLAVLRINWVGKVCHLDCLKVESLRGALK